MTIRVAFANRRFGFTIGPGEPIEAPLESYMICDLEPVHPLEFAERLLAFPGMKPVHGELSTARKILKEPDIAAWWKFWEAFQCRWSSADSSIVLEGIQVLQEENPEDSVFGGILAATDCTIDEYLALFDWLHKPFPSIWIYDQVDSTLLDADAFRNWIDPPEPE